MKRIALLCLACLLLSACGTMRKSWRDTRNLFNEYVDVSPSIDLKNAGIEDKGLQKLARLFGPVDQKLEVFLREIQSQDTPPEPEWGEGLLSRFPWLAGLAVIDAEGAVLAQYPPVGLRAVDFTPLLEFKERYDVRQLACSIQTDELGSLVYVAMPYYKDNVYSGLVVGFFDPRSLIQFCPEPGQLYVIYPDGVLWSGDDPALGEAMLAYAWSHELKDAVQSETTVNGVTYAWQARWIGQMEIVYVTEVSSVREEDEKAPAPENETVEEEKTVSETVTQSPASGKAPATETVTETIQTQTEVVTTSPDGKVEAETMEQSVATASETFVEYTIKPGDTLSKIASEFNVKVEAIQQANADLDPTKLKIGQSVRIPGK